MNLLTYVPEFISSSSVFSPLYNAEQNELNNINSDTLDLVNQCFVETSTWGLDYWEQFLGITTNPNYDINYRRSNILAKIRGRSTSTMALIENVANSYENGTVQVIEHPSTYTIEIKFVSDYGIPPNLTDLQNALSNVMPAHLAIIYTYLYTVWQATEKVTWNTIKSGGTWGNLLNGQIVQNT